MSTRTKLVDLEWLESNFPCMQACPVHTQAGRYVSLIAEGRYEEAYRYARVPNPFASICGRVCGHPCEPVCRRGQFDMPISIRALKRFVTERHGPESRNPIDVFAGTQRPIRPEKIAIIGSGPAGMSAAHDLALLGYPVTVFEAAPVPGGMMHLGIPEYRLPRDVLQAQIREILDLGPELRLNTRLGKDFSLDDLRRQGYKAVLLAFGLHRSRDLNLPGHELDGVVKSIDFLLNVNLGYRFSIGKQVVVIGGGNVAIDVARSAMREQQKLAPGAGGAAELPDELSSSEHDVAMKEFMDVSRQALRMGAREVHLVCLESRAEMPASEEEIEEGLVEGIKMHPSLGPKQFIGSNGKLTGLEVINCTSVFDAQHRFSPTFAAGTEAIIPCDTVILAIGQASDTSFLKPADGIETTRQGTLKIDPATLMTTAPGIFAAGDVAFGPRLIINAVADGKKAAEEIDKFIRGPEWKPKPQFVQITVLDHHQMAEQYDEYSRLGVPVIPLERRTGVAEVEIGFTEEQARREASRCLQCWINTIFEGNEAEGTECILCGGCVDVCPQNCLQLVPLSEIAFSNETRQQLAATSDSRALEFLHLSPDGLITEEGSVMVKDETICIRCGLCAERCPVKTITMEGFEVFDREPNLIQIEKMVLHAMSEIKTSSIPAVPCSVQAGNRITRRDFLNEITLGALGIAGLGSVAVTYQYFSPNVLFEPSTTFRAGDPNLYPVHSVTFLQDQQVYIVRMPEGFYAVSAVCTHLGCVTQWKADAEIIACPCHGSKFKADGAKIEGPAPRPLPHFAISLTADGELLVDKLQSIKSAQVLRV